MGVRSFSMSGSLHSFKDAVTALNSLQSNASLLEEVRKSGVKMRQQSLPEMRDWLRRISYSTNDLNGLNVIHVAGTKGKGSTCAFVSSILQHLFPSQRIGLFTSPHLKSVNERIRINSEPISQELFAKYFWDVWNGLERSADEEGLDKTKKPSYFRFITLMAFHAFLDLKV
jgi:folylpolyglutamate synthase